MLFRSSNPSVTPEHIVPEWYFLPFYAILRAIPDKSLGVIALLSSIIILLFLPYLHTTFVRSSLFKPFYKIFILNFLSNAILLGYLGAKPIESPFLETAQICTLIYFSFFIIIIIVEKIDSFFQKLSYNSISSTFITGNEYTFITGNKKIKLYSPYSYFDKVI